MGEVSLERGTEVGRYTVCGAIASGGMASVHLGRLNGTGGFARRVAIKKLRADLADDPHLVTMLLDEARMSACIHHPNVVSTLDVVVADDEVFVVLEYVHGESLGRLLASAVRRGEPAPIDVVAAIVVGALQGLHAAHEAKDDDGAPLEIVHRDVSPQNILVDTNGNARLLDFGVAKARGRRQISELGALKGKVAYMAPEQVHGEVSRRSDVFSMGVVLWESLTGERLFDGKTDGEILSAVLLAKVPSLRSRIASIPEALDEVVLRSLRRRPLDRFATALELAQAIEASTTVASPAVVAEWVSRLAGETLAKRDRLVADEQAPRTQLARSGVAAILRNRLAVGGAALVLVAAAVVAFAMRAAPRELATGEAEPPPASAPVEDPRRALSPSPPEPEPAPAVSVGERVPSPPPEIRRRATGARGRCDPPYTLDARAHKIYKRDCF